MHKHVGYILLATILLTACGPNQRILNSANENPGTPARASNTNMAPAESTFEKDLEAMRTADFKFIVVFRRKDGASMDAADKELISRESGSQANRRRLSDDGKAIIIGSNFPFLPGMIEKLSDRFKMENYSKPDGGPMISNTVREL